MQEKSTAGYNPHILLIGYRLNSAEGHTVIIGIIPRFVYLLHRFVLFCLANGVALDLPGGFIARSWSERLVYARHGRELMGCKSPVRESSHCREDRVKQVLAEGKGVSARRGLEEA